MWLLVCNNALKGNVPTAWKQVAIIPLPQKGDISLPENYREISLTSVDAKIYNQMILSCIRTHTDPLLWTNQNGFHQGRSTVSQILTLHHVIEEVKEHNLSVTLTSVDFKIAFDSVKREKMFDMLLAYEIPSQIIEGIKELYLDTVAQMVTKVGNTNFFPIVAGVLQGDTLVPYLFIIGDYVRRITMAKDDNFRITLHQQRGRHCPAVCLTDADFAGAIALLSNTINEAQVLLNAV